MSCQRTSNTGVPIAYPSQALRTACADFLFSPLVTLHLARTQARSLATFLDNYNRSNFKDFIVNPPATPTRWLITLDRNIRNTKYNRMVDNTDSVQYSEKVSEFIGVVIKHSKHKPLSLENLLIHKAGSWTSDGQFALRYSRNLGHKNAPKGARAFLIDQCGKAMATSCSSLRASSERRCNASRPR